MVVNPPNVVNDSTIQEVAPLPTTSTMSTITYAALGTVLVGGIGYASFLALKVV
jgi:preprotein translocase subunit Sss1